MVERLWIEPGVFKLSRPGVPVRTANEQNLLFSGDYAGSAKFIVGSINGSRGGSGTTNHEALFGKTFTVPPMALVYIINNSSGSSGGSYPGEAFQSKTLNDCSTPHGFFSFSWTQLAVNVKVDRIQFEVSSASSSFSYTIRYAIFDYRLGL